LSPHPGRPQTGFTWIGKLEARTVEATSRAAIRLINAAARTIRTVTVDNGTEFHGCKTIEAATGVTFFFATPHHSWERGTSENSNGLIRQYAPKRTSLPRLTQAACDRIAAKLNHRPRKRLGFRTPAECYDTE
jgi:IS30 family transposase